MPDFTALLGFGLICLGMVLTPGPNMIYLISRSIAQGSRAGLISLVGIGLGFVIYMLCAAFGLTALAMTAPFAYEALKVAGAGYLLYLAWQTLKPGGRSLFKVRDLPIDGPRKLFGMGVFTSLLNPKIAVMYASLLPQFIAPEHGSVLSQSLVLGAIQIVVSVSVNALIIFFAGNLATFLASRPLWVSIQRWITGSVLAGFAVSLAVESRR